MLFHVPTRIRDTLTVLALVLSTAISAAAAWEVLRQDLPEPISSDPTDVVLMLANDDLTTASLPHKRRLIERLKGEFRRSTDWASPLATLDAEERARFDENFAELSYQFLLDEAEVYFSVPESRRERYLARSARQIFRWRDLARGDLEGAANGGLRGFLQLLEPLLARIEQAEPQQREQLIEFGRALSTQSVRSRLEQYPGELD